MKRTFTLLFLFILTDGRSQDLSLYEKHYFDAPELNLPYRLLRPLQVDSSKRSPLIIFLHGAYEKGNDNERQLLIGGSYFLNDSIRAKHPAFVLFPQCPVIDSWAFFETTIDSATGLAIKWSFPFKKNPTEVSTVLMQLMDSLLHTCPIDTTRIYIAGLSQGGMGVLDLIARFPEKFAAGLAICGAGNVSTTRLFAGKVALWLFHGSSDKIVPVSFSRSYYSRLQKQNSEVRYSEYPGIGHNSWDKVFEEKDLLDWLFAKHKNQKLPDLNRGE